MVSHYGSLIRNPAQPILTSIQTTFSTGGHTSDPFKENKGPHPVDVVYLGRVARSRICESTACSPCSEELAKACSWGRKRERAGSQTYVRIYIYMYVQTYVRMYACKCKKKCMHACMPVDVYTDVCMPVCIYIYTLYIYIPMCACMHACMYACI